MYQTILLAILFLVVIYLLYQNYSIQREIYKIKNSFDELNNFLDLSIKKTKPKVLDTLSSINTTDITDNVITYSNDVRRVKVETTINSDENKLKNPIIEANEQNNHYNIEHVEQNIKQNNAMNTEATSEENINEIEDFNLNDEDIIKNYDEDSDDENSDDENSDDEDSEDIDDDEEDSDDEEDNDDELEEDAINNILKLDEKDNDNELEEDAINNILNLGEKIKSNEIEESEESEDKRQDRRDNILNNIKLSINNELKNNNSEEKMIEKSEVEKIQIKQESETKSNNIEEINEEYSSEKLNKMTINNIKEIAKKFKVVLSISGKAKNKDQLIKDILQKSIK